MRFFSAVFLFFIFFCVFLSQNDEEPIFLPGGQIVITENNAFISQYDICQTISDRLPPQKHRKYLENIIAANFERCFAAFKQSNTEKPYGCLIYASGKIRKFATAKVRRIATV